jgi:hypothetical protein
LVNQDGRVVQRGIFITLVATQTRSQVRSPRPASVEAIAPAPAELG